MAIPKIGVCLPMSAAPTIIAEIAAIMVGAENVMIFIAGNRLRFAAKFATI